ncbi:hypothetical protein ACF09C_19130 [Streptomyces sp. NPDC014870]|uniref:hypothetical protein n=1 Tax=Streptomyces sp. NPDC014870 TaxID=3364925 RepID=UPI0037017FC7
MTRSYRVRAMVALMATVAASLLATTPAQAAPDPGLDLSNFELRPLSNKTELQGRIDRLNADLPNIGVNSLLKEAQTSGRTGQWSNSVCNPAAVESGTTPQGFAKSFCFDDSDNGNSDSEWWPQGVTTVADADEDQTWGDPETGWNPADHKPMLVTWYNKDDWNGDKKADDVDEGGTNTERKGVRISFIDASTGKYAHVLLVYPFINDSGNASYMSVRTSQHYSTPGGKQYGSLHAGGMVWYGYYLYVADTNRGFRVFDLRNIIDLGALPAEKWGKSKTAIGRQDGVYNAHGYRYILPQSDGWTNSACDTVEPPPGTPCDMQDEDKTCQATDVTPKTSFASLDRSSATRHITTGEWCEKAKVTDAFTTGRVIRWPMNTSGGTPALNANGYWAANEAYRVPFLASEQDNGGIQGAAVVNGTYYLSQSRGQANGRMLIARPDTATGRLVETSPRRTSAIGVEDYSVWPGSPNRLWTVTEHPGKRMLFSVTP